MRFDEIPVGDVFKYCDGIYMKAFCRTELGTANALCLIRSTCGFSGEMDIFMDALDVTPVNVQIIIPLGRRREASDD